ncbi:MAG: hypothetical protein Q9169_002755 [Polycauliona sp. 2 TL-2023]
MASHRPSFVLLCLPQEIFLQILEHELPWEDLENLVLCSKAIFAQADVVLTKHRRMKRKYSTFVVGDMESHDSEEHPIPRHLHPLVPSCEILHNHAIANYCKKLKLQGARDIDNVTGEAHTPVDEKALASMFRLSPWLEEWFTNYPPAGIDDVDESKESNLALQYRLAYQIPLLMLRKIEVLQMVQCKRTFDVLKSTWPAIQRNLCNLKEIGLFGDDDCGDWNLQSLGFLRRFAGLPSIRKIHGHGVGDYGLTNEDLPYDDPCALIEEMHFECSDISVSTFAEMLRHIKALRHFYLYQPRYRPAHRYYSETIDILSRHASESLESLTFVGTQHDFRLGSRPQSFRGFSVLKHIAIDCYSLMTNIEYTEVNEHSRELSNVVDLLPRTLGTLELYNPCVRDDFAPLFQDIVELKEERLPNLTSIALGAHYIDVFVNQDVRRDLDKLGVKIVSAEVPSRRYACTAILSDVETPQ